MAGQQSILFVNMAAGYGGGEVQTEELIKYIAKDYRCYLLARRHSKLAASLKAQQVPVQVLSLWQSLRLAWRTPSLVLHAQDGRSAHIVRFLKKLTGKPSLITRHVNNPFKRGASLKAYQEADSVVGVSQQITEKLKAINPHAYTVYGCIRPSRESSEFEQQYFSSEKTRFRIAHVGNFQPIKNHALTLELAKSFPEIDFYLAGSGELEGELKQAAAGLDNVHFSPFTPFVGSIFKHVDMQLLPSHLEGLPGVILEGYQYQVPILAHRIGGIPEIVEDGKTGFLIEDNAVEGYKAVLRQWLDGAIRLDVLKDHIRQFNQTHDFSAQRMGQAYSQIYQQLLRK
ncbi:MAG: glycosyltransferase [Pelistega sp.]|nr:glycosyltransferase [Pelistega sp.]